MRSPRIIQSIKFKLLMLIMVAGAIPMVMATTLFRVQSNSSLIERIADELIEDANSRNNMLTNHIENLTTNTRILSEIPSLIEFVERANADDHIPDDEFLRAAQELAIFQVNQRGNIQHVLLADRHGKVVLSAPDEGWGSQFEDVHAMRSESLPHRGELLGDSIDQLNLEISTHEVQSYLGIDQDRFFENLVLSMHDDAGKTIGYIVIEADIQRIIEVVNQDFEIGETRHLYLTTYDGRRIVGRVEEFSGEAISGTGLFDAVDLYQSSSSASRGTDLNGGPVKVAVDAEYDEKLEGDSEENELVVVGCFPTNDGKEVLGAYVASPILPWVMCVEMDRREVEAPIRAQDRLFLVLGTLGVAVFGMLVFLVGRKFWISLRNVVNAAKRVADGDLWHEIKVTRTDEIGQLECAVNSMRLSMKSQIDQLDAQVAERTSELEFVNGKLLHDTRFDRLTGLANRQVLTECLEHELERFHHDPTQMVAVLFYDFDRFKMVNDSLGHAIGDALLCSIADRFRAGLREEDLCARFGGDEFVVMLPGSQSLESANQISNRLLRMFEEPHNIDGHRIVSTASIGLVISDPRYTSADDMIRDADTAMYQAKLAGKGQVCVFDEQMLKDVQFRLRLEQDLSHAVENNELRVVYQPIVDIENMKIVGNEALIRWEHPELGAISPVDFIPIAEDTGQIVEIGAWIMRESVEQLVRWDKQYGLDGSLSINVNVAKRQLIHPKFIDLVRDILESTGVAPHRLKIEITESTAIDHRHDMSTVIKQIRAIGVKIAMDDFGTGHSSLSLLHTFDLDILKIDQSFVQGMEYSRDMAAVLSSIISLAKNIGMCIVAEGAETESQVACLISHGCDMVQGYYFAKPMPAEEAGRFLDRPFGEFDKAA